MFMLKHIGKILIIAILAISVIGGVGYPAVVKRVNGEVKEATTITEKVNNSLNDEVKQETTTQITKEETTEATKPNNENAKVTQTTVKQDTVVKDKSTNTNKTTTAQNSKPNKPKPENTTVEQTTKPAQISLLTLEPLPESYEAIAFERMFFDKINYQRTSRGLQQLIWNDNLHALTGIRAKETTTKWSHERPNGKMPASLLDERNISRSAFGENLAKGTPMEEQYIDALVEGLMNSPGHKANILNPKYKYSAIGAATDANGIVYVTQLFYTD